MKRYSACVKNIPKRSAAQYFSLKATILSEIRIFTVRWPKGSDLYSNDSKQPVYRPVSTYCALSVFFDDDPDLVMETEEYPHLISMSGSTIVGRLCPEHEANKEYIAEQYRIYAGLHPDTIYIDDDLSSMSCFCPACIRRFAREYSVISEHNAT